MTEKVSGTISNHNLLHLFKRNLIFGAVIEAVGSRRFVVGDLLGVLDGAAVIQVGGDAGPRLFVDLSELIQPLPAIASWSHEKAAGNNARPAPLVGRRVSLRRACVRKAQIGPTKIAHNAPGRIGWTGRGTLTSSLWRRQCVPRRLATKLSGLAVSLYPSSSMGADREPGS
jgi:hypothetical protein